MSKITALLVFIIIVIVFYVVYMSTKRYDKYLEGYWVGDPGFLHDANLRDFQLYVGDVVSGERVGYLIITDANGEYLSNQAVKITGSRTPGFRDAFKIDGEMDFHCSFQSDGELPFEDVCLRLSIMNGTLTIRDDEEVFAFLVKDHSATLTAKQAFA